MLESWSQSDFHILIHLLKEYDNRIWSLVINLLHILFLDIDECTLNDDGCDTNADCANIDSSYTCTCKTGWTGDGFTCTGMFTVDIVNCLNTLASVWLSYISTAAYFLQELSVFIEAIVKFPQIPL